MTNATLPESLRGFNCEPACGRWKTLGCDVFRARASPGAVRAPYLGVRTFYRIETGECMVGRAVRSTPGLPTNVSNFSKGVGS